MERNNLKSKTKIKKKIEQAHKLAISAMINKPEWKPAKGFKYIKDVPIGELVNTNNGLRAVVIENTLVSTVVIVLKTNCCLTEDKNFYLGKHRWGNETEVKIIGE
jgi:hypothetical protein